MEEKQLKIEVYDLEVFPNFFSYTGIDIFSKKITQMYIYDTENEVSNRISAVRYGIKNFHDLFTLISSLALVLRIMYVHFFQQAFGGHNNRSMCR